MSGTHARRSRPWYMRPWMRFASASACGRVISISIIAEGVPLSLMSLIFSTGANGLNAARMPPPKHRPEGFRQRYASLNSSNEGAPLIVARYTRVTSKT